MIPTAYAETGSTGEHKFNSTASNPAQSEDLQKGGGRRRNFDIPSKLATLASLKKYVIDPCQTYDTLVEVLALS